MDYVGVLEKLYSYTVGFISSRVFREAIKSAEEITKSTVAPDELLDPALGVAGYVILFKLGKKAEEKGYKRVGKLVKRYAPEILLALRAAYELFEGLLAGMGISVTPFSGYSPLGSLKDIVATYITAKSLQFLETREALYRDPLSRERLK